MFVIMNIIKNTGIKPMMIVEALGNKRRVATKDGYYNFVTTLTLFRFQTNGKTLWFGKYSLKYGLHAIDDWCQ